MTKVKRNNHTVTRGYLANWKGIDRDGKSGLWYYDLLSKTVIFSQGLRASFAISRDIYSPEYIGGSRDDRLENWFADIETHMCDFTRDFGRATGRRWKPKAVKKALMGIVSSADRGEFAIETVKSEIQTQFPDLSLEQVHLRALNNVYSVAHHKASEFLKGTAIIVEANKPTFMTNDQPFLDMSPRSDEPMGVFPLSPTRALALLPSQRPIMGDMQFPRIKEKDAPTIVEFIRQASMRTARRWVVCSSKEEACDVANYLTDEVLNEVMATDRVLYFKAEEKRWLFTTDG